MRPERNGVDSVRSWVTAAACFVIQFVGVGSIRGSGVLFVALMETNSCSREEATWPFTVFGAASIIFAPMSGFLTSVLPIRPISMVGVFLLALGSSVCFFSTDIYFVSIFYGLLRAAGCSMCVNLIPGIINISFQRYRASAMGIATSGDSMGALVFPLLTQYLLTSYLLKGTFLLLGGIVLQGVLGAVLLAQVSEEKKPVIAETAGQEETELGETLHGNPNNKILMSLAIETNNTSIEIDTQGAESKGEHLDDTSDSDDPNSATSLIPKNIKTYIDSPPSILQDKSSCCEDKSEDFYKEDPSMEVHFDLPSRTVAEGDLKLTNEEGERLSFMQTPERLASSPNPKENTKKICSFDTVILKNILTSRGFYLIQLCQIADSFLVNNYSLLIVDYVSDKYIPLHKGLFMLTVFPIGQLFGRMGLGWITDRKFISRPFFLFVALNLCAALTLLLTYLYEYASLLTCAAVLGVCGGSLHPITAVLLSDYLRKEEVHLAVAITISIKGLAQLPRVPLVGYFRDHIGSYDHLFHVTVGVLCLAALAWFCEGLYLKRRGSTPNVSS